MIAFLLAFFLAPAPDFEARVREVITHNARPASLETAGYQTIAAKLWLKEDPAWCSRRLKEILDAGPTGDMFWMFPVTAIAYLDQGQLTAEARQALRDSWRTYMPFRGDTENHWLLYYTSMYLMAQKYPGEDGSRWFNGKSSAENFREADEWIRWWVDFTTRKGQGEYDCTHYIGVYVLPMSYLAAWAEEPAMRKRASMMLEYLMADYAAEQLDGIYVGSHARTDDRQVLEKWYGISSDLGWLLFGLGYHSPHYGSYPFYYAVASAYEPPPILKRIATQRADGVLHKELKRTRHRWRFHEARNGEVYKTTYLRDAYAVGSDQGGLLQPVQQHSWDVTWKVADPRGIHNTLFTVHPYSGMMELQAYFTFAPDPATEMVYRSKKSYDSPDKLLGGSPYEQIFQDRDTVIVLYDIAPGARFPHINGFFSKDLSMLVEDASGWIFARGGDSWIAYYPLAPYSWKPIEGGGKRLFSPYLKNGAVVQAAAASEFASLDAFRAAILALPLEVRREPVPSVRFRSLRGADLRFTYGEQRDFSSWQLFDGPHLQAGRESGMLEMRHGGERRVLDFRALTITQ
ncbi:MAG: hypothetical protein MUF01_00955 [Bryobacterales bacterium]|jgi:hypothetical protein|nr:hypothetical protein [Bryobacterales bacterium]